MGSLSIEMEIHAKIFVAFYSMKGRHHQLIINYVDDRATNGSFWGNTYSKIEYIYNI